MLWNEFVFGLYRCCVKKNEMAVLHVWGEERCILGFSGDT
jgi:hypothetical protein